LLKKDALNLIKLQQKAGDLLLQEKKRWEKAKLAKPGLQNRLQQLKQRYLRLSKVVSKLTAPVPW